MQFFQVLALAFATTAMAKVHNDNSPIPDSVERPSNAVPIQANAFGTAVKAASAKRHPKALQARSFGIYVCEHANFEGACLSIGGIDSGVCCKFLCPGFETEPQSTHSKRYLMRENRQYQRYLERCHLVH